jgi:hypothetical protein
MALAPSGKRVRAAYVVQNIADELQAFQGVFDFQATLLLFRVDWQDFRKTVADPGRVTVFAGERFVQSTQVVKHAVEYMHQRTEFFRQRDR